jgi:hypothetical protein
MYLRFRHKREDMKTQRMPLTDDHLTSHLRGQQTIGVYQLDKDDTVKYACIDIDIEKSVWNQSDFSFDEWEPKISEQVSKIKNKLASYGIVGYTEMSGFKGAHVWYFFENPLHAGTVRDMNNIMFGSMSTVDENIHLEFFPKQDHIDAEGGGLGNLIKLPHGKHKKSNDFSYFLDDVMTDAISFVGKEQINKVINPIDSIFLNCEVMNGIRNRAKQGYLNHNERLTLGYILLNVEGGEKELRRLIQMQEDYDKKTTDYQIDQIKAKKYKPITCSKLQSSNMDHMCPGPCANIGSGKSPVTFYYRHTGKINVTHPGQDAEISDPTSKLDMFQKQGTCFYYTGGREPEMISNFIVNINREITRDDGQDKRIELQGQVVLGDNSYDYSINSDQYSQDEKLKASIYGTVGNAGVFCDKLGQLRHAINKYTTPDKVYIKEVFGYEQNGEDLRYITPSTIVDKFGIRENNEIIVDLGTKDYARNLDLIPIYDEKEFEELKRHINEELFSLTSFGIMHATLAHTMSPIIEPWLYPMDPTRYTLFIKGTTGGGKSFMAKAFQHFYGPKFIEVSAWKNTPHRVELQGFDFKDALYLVDDWKKSIIGREMQAALGILQTYADRSARGRLNKNAELVTAKPIRGTLLVTGEDLPEGQSSVLARTITLDYKQKVKNLRAGRKVLENLKKYSAVTARYIHHILNLPNKEEIYETQFNYQEKFYKNMSGVNNDVRMSRNLSLLYTSYHYFSNWFWNKKTAENYQERLYEYLIENTARLIQLTGDERPTVKFWVTMTNLLVTGRLRLQATDGVDNAENKNTPIIGFRGSGSEDYLMLTVALREVIKYLKYSGEELGFSNTTIIEDLYEEGYINSRAPQRKHFNRSIVEVYPVDQKKLRN